MYRNTVNNRLPNINRTSLSVTGLFPLKALLSISYQPHPMVCSSGVFGEP